MTSCHVFCDIIVTFLVALMTLRSVNSYNEDRCDTIVWDLGGSTLGVHDVNGSCSEGHVEWRNPYGAIRITLQLRPGRVQPRVGVAFESCFTLEVQHSSVRVFLDDTKSDLIPIVTLDSSNPATRKELCFRSERDPIVLYIESELEQESAVFGLVQMDYDNHRLPVTMATDRMEECRPCTDTEILQAVCSSDFVLTGSMSEVNHHHDLEQTSLHLKVAKVFRQRHNLFKDPRSRDTLSPRSRKYPRLNFHTENGVREYPDTEAPTSISQSDSLSQSDGVIYAPKHCGIRRGHGDFLFIGRIRLKKAFLRCAPRLEDFNRIWKQAVRTGSNMCLLQ